MSSIDLGIGVLPGGRKHSVPYPQVTSETAPNAIGEDLAALPPSGYESLSLAGLNLHPEPHLEGSVKMSFVLKAVQLLLYWRGPEMGIGTHAE